MKNLFFYLMILLSISLLTSCTPLVHHADPFYNVNDDFSMNRIPLINPIEANRLSSSFPWDIELHPGMWVDFPKSQGLYYLYGHVHELEKFAVKNGVIMAYSSYIDKDADAYIQNNYYHWFVIVPNKEITKGFHTENEFREYIQTLGVEDSDWQTPDEAFEQFRRTGCLEWIPDCK
jgi:hypothetical protein